MQDIEYGALELTPTWTIAIVCSVFILASFALVRAIHYMGRWLNSHGEKSLNQALDKIKEELMLLGFISLLLTVFQSLITSICVPHNFRKHMLPCQHPHLKPLRNNNETSQGHSRRLLFLDEHLGRLLSEEASKTPSCVGKEKVQFVSNEGLHELHIFIFVLAVVHVVYSCVTLVLGRYKVNGWNAWEKKAQMEQAQSTFADNFSRHKTFLSRQADPRWTSSRFLSWIVCFFRQFGRSVTAAEYKALRMGFIRNHNLQPDFNFHKYVLRVLEDDFKGVVGISGYLWAFVVIFLLLNVNDWDTYFWIAFLPLGLLLIVGAKLQHIIMVLGVEMPVNLDLRDELFWFSKPKLVLYLLHFILFQNAFELAFFVWIWAIFGFTSCFMENLGFLITRLVIGVIVQVLCSYSTLPLYALVTQMGTHFKFGEEIQSALSSLHEKVKKKSEHGVTASSLHVKATLEPTSSEPAIKSIFQTVALEIAMTKPSDVEMADSSPFSQD